VDLRPSRRRLGFGLVAAGLTLARGARCDETAWGDWRRWGDQQDGYYRNPVLPADFSDIDVIGVGQDYYAIASSMQLSPGMSVLHSRDLVNWATISHVVSDLTTLGPDYGWRMMGRYGRGVWAGAIRHHAGAFWVFFGTPDEGYFMSRAVAAVGPWSTPHPVLFQPGWDDCCPLWDDDGRAYLVGTHFADGYRTWMFPMSPDGREIDRSRAALVNQGQGREANKLLKIGGRYFLLFSADIDGVGRCVMARRAEAPMGPYGPARQLAHDSPEALEPNQGGLVETPSGAWYFFTHHGHGAWEGRAASLLPVSWRGGWPIIGTPQPDGMGAMAWGGRKPIRGRPVDYSHLDGFDAPMLDMRWQWNHQPRDDHWSLTERPGWLRLRAWPALIPGDVMTAGDTISQPSFRTAANSFTAKLDIGGMVDGQQAGLIHFSHAHARLAVLQSDGQRRIAWIDSATSEAGPRLAESQVWLRSQWGSDGQARFAFSADGRAFRQLGPPYQMSFGDYRGDRIGLFTFNDRGDAGWVDIDWVDYEVGGGAP